MKHQASLDETIVPSALSIVGSCTIIFTYIIFRDLRRLRYIELVYYVAINSLIAAIGFFFNNLKIPLVFTSRSIAGACMGNVSHNAAACYFQDVTTSANNVSAAFWTTVIAYQLWVASVNMGQTLKDIRFFHIVCWLVPWILVFLPLSTNTFGIPDEGGSWCFIDNRAGSPKWGIVFWEMVSVYVPIAISIVVMTALLISVAIQIKTNTLSELMIVALRKLYLYPVVFVVCWIPSVVADIVIADNSDANISPVLRGFGNVMPCLQGFFISIVFFSHNTIVRDHWMHILNLPTIVRFFCCDALFGGSSEGIWSQNEPEIKVMMSAEKESDYIDDETRNAFAFRVSFSSAGTSGEIRNSELSNYNSNNPLTPRDVSIQNGDIYVMSSSQSGGSPVYVPGGSQSSSRNLDSALSPQEPPKVGTNGRGGMLSSTPKMSFLYKSSPAMQQLSSSLPHQHQNQNQQMHPEISIQDQNERNMASSMTSDGGVPMSSSFDRAIQMSSTSSASSNARVVAREAGVPYSTHPTTFGVASENTA